MELAGYANNWKKKLKMNIEGMSFDRIIVYFTSGYIATTAT